MNVHLKTRAASPRQISPREQNNHSASFNQSFIAAVSNASAASKAIHEKEYAQIWLRAENVFLPHHLQPMGTLFTAQITLLVSSEEIAHNNVFRSSDSRKGTTTYHVPKESWSEFATTPELKLSAQGNIGESFLWPDALQIPRTAATIQLVRFDIKINANMRVGSLICNLPDLLLANDGGTHETKKLFKCENGSGADSVLIISARSRIARAFHIKGDKEAKTVMTCREEDLRIRTATGIYKLRPFQLEAMRRLREKMKSPRKIERKASELLIVEPTTGEVLYIDSAGDANEIFYSEPPLHPKFKMLMYVHRFIFLLKKKYRTYQLAALQFPNIGMTIPRFDDVTQMLWNRAGKNRSSPTENYKTLRRRLQVALATGRKTLDEAADALETNVSSIVFVPEFKLDDKLLAKLPSKMCNRQQIKDVREHLRLWHGFVASWKEEEHVRTKTIFKELNGESSAAEVKRHRRNALLCEGTERHKLFEVMHTAELRDARVSPKALTAARDASMEKLPAADFLVRCAQLQELNHWEYTQYTQALGLLNHIYNELQKIRSYKIEKTVQRSYGRDNVFKQMHKQELNAHGEFHKLCVQLSWYRHVLVTVERILRYQRLSLLNSTMDRRIQTLKKLQAHISKFGADVENITYEKIVSPLELFKQELEVDCASRLKASMGYKSLSLQLLAITETMKPANEWQERVRSSEPWRKFVLQVNVTSTQMIKMLKWSTTSCKDRSVSIDALVRMSFGTLPTETELADRTLKALDGDYKLEACTPFHLNFKIIKLVHKIWDQHFSHETQFKQFLAIVPQITGVCCVEGQRSYTLNSCVCTTNASSQCEERAMVQLLGTAKSLEVFMTIKTSLDKAKEQLSKNLLSTIQYLDHHSDREKYRIVCKNGFMTDFVGTPYDTQTKFSNHAGNGYAIFVFHKKMGMFASSHVVRYDMDPDVVLSINDFVFTLGELKVSNGILKVVTAKSGHYKPRRLQGFIFLRWLIRNGFDLDEIEYREVDPTETSGYRVGNAKTMMTEYEDYFRTSTSSSTNTVVKTPTSPLSPPPPRVPPKPKNWKEYRSLRGAYTTNGRLRDSLDSAVVKSLSHLDIYEKPDEDELPPKLNDVPTDKAKAAETAMRPLRRSLSIPASPKPCAPAAEAVMRPLRRSLSIPASPKPYSPEIEGPFPMLNTPRPSDPDEENSFSEGSPATSPACNATAAATAVPASVDPVPPENLDSIGDSNSSESSEETRELPVQDIVVLLKSAMKQATQEEEYDLALSVSKTVASLEEGTDRTSASAALDQIIETLVDFSTFDSLQKKLRDYL